MDYEAVLAQALTLLQREQRLSYRVLKLRLQLDDDTLEALKEDLIFAKKLAADEEGRVLVWTGGTSSASTAASSALLPATPEVSPAQAAASPGGPSTPDAERRQLTVMFCDLVDATTLSGRLDPEEYRDVVRAYQATCTEVIRRYDGHIAQLLGDGLLVYFGYPRAHEDDAHRAVRTGLGILTAIEDPHTRLHQQAQGIQLAIRIGVHTGLVVIGDMGGQGRQEQLALGEVPNVCARIQGVVEPNTIAMSEATYRLVQGYFTCQDLGAQTLRGVAEPLHVYQVLSESGVHSRLDIASARGLTPLVGREQEVGVLLERWEQAKAGHGHVVLLSGEAGIGKSRLVQTLKDHVAHEPYTRWECRSAEYYENTALFPLVELFQRLLQFHAEDTLDEKVGKLEQVLRQYRLPVEETMPLFASILSLPLAEERYAPLALSPQRQRQKTLETLVAILLERAEHQPLLFILEDLHWTDPTTLAWLHLLIDQTPTASMLVLLTCRPHFQPAWHHRSYLTEMTLNRLSHVQLEQIVAGMTDGKTFPAEVLQQISAKTDGVPLFVEEITKSLLESGQLTAVDGHYALIGSLSTFAIPATLQDSLMARLDRLVTAKGVAQMGATIGRQFAYDVLQAVAQLDESMLQRELGRLVEAEIVYQRGVPPQAIYTFKHALIQDAAYQSLLRSTRQQYHQRIAHVLAARFPETAETQPEVFAQHYTEAGLGEQAVRAWQRAGQQALQRSAHLEAISHLTRGLAVLATLPETPVRIQQELDLHILLGPALIATKGHAALEVEQTYGRARVLCAQVGDAPQLVPTLRGLCQFYLTRGILRTAQEVGEQLAQLAQREPDPLSRLLAQDALGNTLYYLGHYTAARTHLAQGGAPIDVAAQRALALRQGTAPGVRCLAMGAHVLWCLGYPIQAVQRSQEALALAQTLAHPLSLATAQHCASWLHQRRRDIGAVREQADALLRLAMEQQFPTWVGYGTFWQGWILAAQGQGEAGLAQMRQGITAVWAPGQAISRPFGLVLLAEVVGRVGHVTEGLHLLAEAREALETNAQGDMRVEAHRLQGELLLRQATPDAIQAEACFHQALALARRQQAKSWELRAAISLCRLWQRQGKRAEAYELLAPIYGWFTEGFDTADLQEAKALLEELAG